MVKADVTTPAAILDGRFVSETDPRSPSVDLRKRLDDLTRLVSDWIWETDADLKVTFVSDRVLDVLGHHPSVFQGRPLIDVVTVTKARATVRKLAARTPFRNVPCEVQAQDGARRQFLLSGIPVFCLESGAFLGFRGTAEDVTERRAAEQALHRRNTVLVAISRAATVLLASADWRQEMPEVLARLGEASETDRLHLFEAVTGADGEALAINRFHWCHARVAQDCPPSHHRDLPLHDFGFGGWEKRLREGTVVVAETETLSADQQVLLSDEAVRSVLVVPVFAGDLWWGFLRFDRLDPAVGWADVEVEALRAAAGIIGAAVHRGHSARCLRASEARFETAFHTSPDAIVITRVDDGVVLEVNDGFSRLTGHDRLDAIGRPVTSLGLWNERTWERTVMRELLKNDEVRDVESAFPTRDGAHPVRFAVGPAGGTQRRALRPVGDPRHDAAPSGRRDHSQAFPDGGAKSRPGDDHRHRRHHRIRQSEIRARDRLRAARGPRTDTGVPTIAIRHATKSAAPSPTPSGPVNPGGERCVTAKRAAAPSGSPSPFRRSARLAAKSPISSRSART